MSEEMAICSPGFSWPAAAISLMPIAWAQALSAREQWAVSWATATRLTAATAAPMR